MDRKASAAKTDDNVDASEILKFEALAARWWDSQGDSKSLHDINPLRLGYIDRRAGIAGRRILDVGCGGGILSEAMAALGGEVTGIDMGQAPLSAAKHHLQESGLKVDYRKSSAEALAERLPGHYDLVTCMELLEHVPDPYSVIRACEILVKPGGDVFFATINRNPKAFLFAIVGAEYVLNLVPRGTHGYNRFVKPSEMRHWAGRVGLTYEDSSGLHYNLLTRRYWLGGDLSVNYIMHFKRQK